MTTTFLSNFAPALSWPTNYWPTVGVGIPLVLDGPIAVSAVTSYTASDISAASFHHETPAGDNRALLVVAVYKDTAGVNSLAFGSSGTGDGQFDTAHDIAFDSDGNIYVTDSSNHRVQKFDSSGSFLLKWGTPGSGNGQFANPSGIAVSSDGYVYVVDRSNHRVQKFDSSGAYVTKWGSNGSGNGEFNTPFGIAVDSDGSVYVADGFNSRVQKFDSSGAYVTKWGSNGSGNGEFDGLRMIACGPTGNVYTTETVTDRVQVFDSIGTHITTIGEEGKGNGQFRTPYGIAVGVNGDIYVVDDTNCRVQRFNGSYEFVSKWGVFGSGDGQFIFPLGIDVSADGIICVADTSNYRIQVFSAGLKLNAAYYDNTRMDVGPLVDGGNYFLAFYTLIDPPVGDYEVALNAPTGPDVFLITAISLTGVETINADYTAPDAGRAETEDDTTQLQVSHDRDYPAYALSIWSVLYEGATTLTAAADNYLWLSSGVGTLYNAIGLRHFATADSGDMTFGATASPAVTPRISAVIHIEASWPRLEGAYIEPTTTLYGGTIALAGQTMYGAYIEPTTTLYGGQLNMSLTGAYIDATTELYGGTIAGPPTHQYLDGSFIGVGFPSDIQGPYIDATTELYAGEVTTEILLAGAYIDATTALYEGAIVQHASTATAQIYAGTIAHV